MKELSIEEKAKAYDEAIERARLYKGLQAEMSVVFPELKKESEDENIREFLVEFIKVCGWSEKQFPPKEQCIAWLEKQSKQNNAWSEEDSIMYNRLLSFAESEFGGEYDLVKWLKSFRDRKYE